MYAPGQWTWTQWTLWTGLHYRRGWPLLTYGVCGLAVLHHVQAPDLVGGVHAELADCLHRDQGVAAQHVHTLVQHLEEAEGEDAADCVPAHEGPGPRHVPGQHLQRGQGAGVCDTWPGQH